jgi:hypothetical protein
MDENVWAKLPGSPLKKPALLVCDQFRAHVTEAMERQLRN